MAEGAGFFEQGQVEAVDGGEAVAVALGEGGVAFEGEGYGVLGGGVGEGGAQVGELLVGVVLLAVVENELEGGVDLAEHEVGAVERGVGRALDEDEVVGVGGRDRELELFDFGDEGGRDGLVAADAAQAGDATALVDFRFPVVGGDGGDVDRFAEDDVQGSVGT